MENNLEMLRGIDERFIYELTRNEEELDSQLSLFALDETVGDYGRHSVVIEIAKKLGIGYRRWKHD